jgi:hypothetical protein
MRLSLVLSLAIVLAACHTSPGLGDLPDPSLTPGDVMDVTRDDICAPGYTEKVRDVSAPIKRQVYASYHRERREGVCCEVDHLVPLELGGSNRMANLWPQLYIGAWNAHVKDGLEARLHHLVCSGNLELRTAQQAIAKDWIAAYRLYEVRGPVPGRRTPRR